MASVKQKWLDVPLIVATARAVYEAKKKDAWGNWQSEYRKAWPETDKDLRTALHEETDPGLEFAFVQAVAAIKVLKEEAPLVVVHVREAGDVVLDYYVTGGPVKLLIVDEGAPNDRVYECLQRHERADLDKIIGDSPIGSMEDERHAAIKHKVDNFIDGKSYLSTVDDED